MRLQYHAAIVMQIVCFQMEHLTISVTIGSLGNEADEWSCSEISFLELLMKR